MVESQSTSSENAQCPTTTGASRSPPLNDDDEEPPSTRPIQNGHPQVTAYSPSDTPHFPPVKSRDTFIADTDNEKVDIESGMVRHDDVDDNTETLTTLGGDTRREHPLQPRVPRTKAAKPWYRRFSLSKKSRLRTLFTPTHDIGPRPTHLASLKAALFYSYLNLLLVFIPVSWGLHFSNQSPTLVFVFSCLAIIPLAALLGLGTEQIALRTSQSVGGLLNATLGNVVELIIGAIALKQCELELVQSSLLGGLLSNLLLVLGCAFLVGGFRYQESEFQPTVAQLNSSLLIVAVIAFFLPTVFHLYLENRLADGLELPFLLRLSHGSAIIMLVVYLSYLFFQFYSHNHLFADVDIQTSSTSSASTSPAASSVNLPHQTQSMTASRLGVPHDPLFGSRISLASALQTRSNSSKKSDGPEQLKLNLPAALLLLGIVTALVYFTADNLVASLEGLVESNPGVSKKWLTLIVIPIVGNAAEYATAVFVASKGKFNLSMSVAVGSCIQIAFFVIPILVLVAWGLGKPLTLLFDPTETLAFFFAVLVVKFAVEDGKSHWLNGLALISVYTIIALAFWGFPVTLRTVQGQALVCIT